MNKQVENVPLVATYHLPLNGLNKTIIDKMHPLHADQEVKEKLPIKPKVSFRSARKNSSYLMQAKIYSIERKVGSCRLSKQRCQICVSVNETNTFSSFVTQEAYKINNQIDCDDNYLSYFLTCRKYLK